MNADLLENAVNYHGKKLFELILKQNNCNPSKTPPEIEHTVKNNNEIINKNLNENILNFIAKKSDYLFSEKYFSSSKQDCIEINEINENNEIKNDNKKRELIELGMPPIETFMNVPSRCRKEHLFKYIEPGDVVIGNVDRISDQKLYMHIICFDNHKKRDFSRLKFNIICPIENGINSDTYYQIDDLVRCTIVSVDEPNDVCHASLINSLNSNIIMGPVLNRELPGYYVNIEDYEKEAYSYRSQLKYEKAFNNPACYDILAKKLGLSKHLGSFSLLKGLYDFKIPKGEMAGELLKLQNKNLALQNVQKGINLAKENRNMEAVVFYNKALSIDEDNVEALVARGALHANEGEFSKAIDDLEKALNIEPNHTNAKIYLKEVFIANAVKLEKKEKYEDSLVYLKRSLEIEPKNELIISKMNTINKKMDEMYSKVIYGPTLPKHSKPKNEDNVKRLRESPKRSRRRSTSSSSSSNDSIKIIKQDHKSRSPNHKNGKHEHIYKSETKDNKHTSRGLTKNLKYTKTAAEEDDDEDLEEFLNKLKKNKANNSFSKK